MILLLPIPILVPVPLLISFSHIYWPFSGDVIQKDTAPDLITLTQPPRQPSANDT